MSRLARRSVITVALILLVAALGWTQAGSARRLSLNEWVRGTVPLGNDWQTTTYRVFVRDGVFSVRFELADSPADLDLFLSDGTGELLTFSELPEFSESLYISRVSEPRLRSGQLTLEVVYPFDRLPVVDGRELDRVPFRIHASTVEMQPLATLRPGSQVTGRLLPENSMAALYEIRVDEDVDELRLDVSETDADVDLFLAFGEIPPDIFQADVIAQTLRSSESIVISRSSTPRLQTGTYQLLVVDQVTLEQEAEFRLSVSDSIAAPGHLGALPQLPAYRNGLQRALLSTVEVLAGSGSGGSGCLISASGAVLTNWHVVQGTNGEADADITIGMSLDNRRPPEELFKAEVVEISEDRDLALLRITGDRYGRPLPAGYELPFVDIRSDPTWIAESLHIVGYPGVGGTGSRASITYTTGVVSGFQQTSYGYEIKTDAEINSGSSGGAALDSSFRLIGIPTSIVGEESGQLAYIVPVEAIPEEWMHHLR